MENIYVKCIEQILKVEPPMEEARELIMRVVKQELQYSDKLTESQKSEAIELLSFMQFPLKIKRELYIQRLEVRHASLPALGIGLLAGIATEELLNKQSRWLRLPLATVAGVAFGSIYSLCIEKPIKMPTPKTTRKERIISTAEEIQQDIERLIDLLSRLSGDSFPSFNKEQLDIVKWYQKSYAEVESFGMEFKTYLRGRIERILSKQGLRLMPYSSGREEWFQVSPTKETVAAWPAVLDGEQLLLPGINFIQSEH